jgi:hypothetical protein
LSMFSSFKQEVFCLFSIELPLFSDESSLLYSINVSTAACTVTAKDQIMSLKNTTQASFRTSRLRLGYTKIFFPISHASDKFSLINIIFNISRKIFFHIHGKNLTVLIFPIISTPLSRVKGAHIFRNCQACQE